MSNPFNNAFSEHVWRTRYRAGDTEKSVEQTWRRVANALAGVEADRGRWSGTFFDALAGFRFLPAGRILAGAGIDDHATLVNCFVASPPEPTAAAELAHLADVCRTLEFGGGVGCDFSAVPARAGEPGLVEYLSVWDAVAGMAASSRFRRGALMGACRCDHPHVERFIAAKNHADRLTHFNLSVLLTDAFMRAVEAGESQALRTEAGDVVAHVDAAELFAKLARSACDHGDPGVLFVDTINRENNLGYREAISATNPCGEVPLPPHGACVLGSINLATLVRDPFTARASFDFDELARLAHTGVRLLDDVVDATVYPLPAQREHAQSTRRVGLGVTGLGDAVAMLGWRYGEVDAVGFVGRVMRALSTTAYETSVDLAQEKGTFPAFDRRRFLQSGFARRLPEDTRALIERHGIRNSHLLAIAPAGSISLLANNVSSGIEPIFSLEHERMVVEQDGARPVPLQDYAMTRLPAEMRGSVTDIIATAADIEPRKHVEMVAAAARFVDNAIAKTINLPEGCGPAEVESLFQLAHERNLKGCTVFPAGGERQGVLRSLG